MKSAVFLDRDGVLNVSEVRGGKPYAPTRLEDFHIFPGIAATLHRLKARGFVLVVVSNQPDIGNGLVDIRVVEAMTARLRDELPVDEVRVCPHKQTDGCDCRKPRPGMLLDAAGEIGLDLDRSYVVGDRWNDVAAGRAVGCRTVFIERGYQERRPDSPDKVVASLAEAAEFILSDVQVREACHESR